MSTLYSVDIQCDHCADWIHVYCGAERFSVRAGLRAARHAGWSRDASSKYLDLCPACVKLYQQGELQRSH